MEDYVRCIMDDYLRFFFKNMESTNNHLAPGKTLAIARGARYAVNEVDSGSSACNLQPAITSYFSPIADQVDARSDTLYPEANKKVVVLSCNQTSNHTLKNPMVKNVNAEIFSSEFPSYYPKMSSFKYKRCGHSRCKLCPAANPCQISPKSSFKKFCKVYNCVYKLTCNLCQASYVGQTQNPLNIRINLHRSQTYAFLKSARSAGSDQTHEIKHFANHGIDNISVSILDIIPETKKRLWWENYYILNQQTIYPYGLNSQYFGRELYCSEIARPSVYSLFRRSKSLIRGKRGGKALKSNLAFYTSKLCSILDEDGQLNLLKRYAFSIPKRYLLQFYQIVHNHNCVGKSFYGKDVLMDLLKFRIVTFKLLVVEPLSSNPSNKLYCSILFHDKSYDDLNLTKMFSNLATFFPLQNVKVVGSFRYAKPFCRSVYNYNSVSRDLKSSCPAICNCLPTHAFFNQDYLHVITGNTKIVSDPLLRNVLDKGTGFRTTPFSHSENLRLSFIKDIDQFIYSSAVKFSYPLVAFNQWRDLLSRKFEKFLRERKQSPTSTAFKHLKPLIYNLQRDYVITYVDKVTSNYSFVCKLFYCKQLQVAYDSSGLYLKIQLPMVAIVNRIKAFYKKLDLVIKSIKLPYLVLIPKYHKKPVIKFRTVTVGCGSYMEVAGKALLKVFKIILQIISKHDKCIIVKNSFEVVQKLKTLPPVSNFLSLDFADLFNSIDLDDLYKVLLSLHNQYNLKPYITLAKYKHLLQFVIFENYLYQGDSIYKQTKGIAMGGSCSSAMADIYLDYYERNALFSNDFSYFRYVDDLILLSHNYMQTSDFSFNFYPPTLNLIPNPINNDGSIDFLDINLKLYGNKVFTKLFDKRNLYTFKINRVIHWQSNIHKNIFRNILTNFLNRNIKLNSDSFHTITNAKKFILYATEVGFPLPFLINKICKYLAIPRQKLLFDNSTLRDE